MNRGLVLVLMVVILLTVSFNAFASRNERISVRIPTCAEDEQYLKGKGDFNGQRWSRYVCIHNDRVGS